MPKSVSVRWKKPPTTLAKAVEEYGSRVFDATASVCQYTAQEMQNTAREQAPWTDRTGNARSGLFATAEADAGRQHVVIYLSHAADLDYGVWLELANSGWHAIILPTMERHYPELKARLKGLFK